MIRRAIASAVVVATCLAGEMIRAYPLDASEETGMARLEGYRLAQQGAVRGRILPSGALLPSERIQLRLLGQKDLTLPEPDPSFSASVKRLLGAEASRYGVSVLDLSDPLRPRYAEHNGSMIQNPGSVGKILVALAWFQSLADLFPDDVEARKRLLRETMVTADGFIRTDHHTVPFWKTGEQKITKRPIHEGDTANLWTFMDWMCSSSSNAAASTMMAQLVLLEHFDERYPVPEKVAVEFFEKTPKAELQSIFSEAIQTPVNRNGLDLDSLRQGSFFTREGKRRVSGTSSHATSRELLKYALLMEQGELVDEWSSLEIKRLLYLTDRRIRYASSPALRNAAVYFKSGSLYSCKAEPEFQCKKYHGNVRNYMNSLAMVETDQEPGLDYIVAVMSNVLRKNSAVEHQTLGTRIHRLIEKFHQPPVPEEPSVDPEAPISEGSRR